MLQVILYAREVKKYQREGSSDCVFVLFVKLTNCNSQAVLLIPFEFIEN